MALALAISFVYSAIRKISHLRQSYSWHSGVTEMKLRDHRLAVQGDGSIVNQEIIRARALIADLKLNNKKAQELTHTARNLITVRRIMLEQIRWRKHRSLTNH